MSEDPSGNAGPPLSIGSDDQENSGGRFRLSNKLVSHAFEQDLVLLAIPHSISQKEEFDKLAPWRIDSSLIAFPDDPREFYGGNAAVAQAFLASLSDDEASIDDSQRSSEERPGLDGLILKFDDATIGSEYDGQEKEGHQESEPGDGEHDNNNDGEEVQRSGGQPEPKGEGQKQESDDESPSFTVSLWCRSGICGSPSTHGHSLPHPEQVVAVKKLRIADDTDVERVLGVRILHRTVSSSRFQALSVGT